MMRERILSIKRSGRKGKKYVAIVQDRRTRRRRSVHFGAVGYDQYKDSTGLGHFTHRDHMDRRRRRNYFSRHSAVRTKRRAIRKERRKSRRRYTPKLLSHRFLWWLCSLLLLWAFWGACCFSATHAKHGGRLHSVDGVSPVVEPLCSGKKCSNLLRLSLCTIFWI